MLIGYARVSQDTQDHALQLDALQSVGCDKVFVEVASGATTDRPELAKALERTRQGDVLIGPDRESRIIPPTSPALLPHPLGPAQSGRSSAD
jgi:DNA invertase Pin-like site-specific DNA recombinase